jgi:FkbM family methyltransferase
MMRSLLKKIYYALPFKRTLFRFVRVFYRPSVSKAGYLKFKGTFVSSIAGKDVVMYNNNLTVPTLLFWRGIGGYEPATLKVWVKLSQQSATVFDVGANFGLFGLISRAVNPSSRVYCFEPLTRNATLIERNSQLNHFDITVVHVAVSNKAGSFTFYDMADHDNTIGSFDKDFVLSHKHHKELVPTDVKTITLDDYADEISLQTLDLMKIDVEGHEVAAIEGARRLIARNRPSIILEVSDDQGKHVESLLREIYSGYVFYAIDEVSGIVKVESLMSRHGRNFLIIDGTKNGSIV